MDKIKTIFSKISLWIFIGLLAYVPLHILISIWLGSYLGILDFMKIAKDIALVLGLVTVAVVAIDKKWLASLKTDKLTWFIGAYALLTIIMSLILPVDQDAEILGLIYNLRFLAFFVYAVLLTRLYKADWLMKKVLVVVLSVALLVMVFGFVQYMWLPDDALTKIGYSRSNGALPAFFIDDKPDLERIMSTVRDPNSLGSYLIIILSLSLVLFLNVKNKDLKQLNGGLLALSVLCLWFTFSRSAWLGALLAVLIILYLSFAKDRKMKIDRRLLFVLPVVALIFVGGLYVARDSYFVKNVILHADESTVLEDPNELRVRFWQESLESAINNPLGHGVGTAGLASIRNEKQGTVLNENYYLQILYEVGVIGLALFLLIIAVVACRLFYISEKEYLALALLASFAGLALTNFLVHIWSNEAVSYTWWGLAGLILYKDGLSKNIRVKKKV